MSSKADDVLPPLLPRRDSLLPPAPAPARFSSDDVNVLRYFTLFRRQGPAALVLAHTYVALTQVGSSGVLTYCRATLGYSNARIRGLFSRDELHELEGNWDPFQKDITFLYKLLQNVCGLAPSSDKVWSVPSHALEFLLRTVKTFRNHVSHSLIKISDSELQDRTKELLTDLRAILAHVASRTHLDLDRIVQKLEEDILQIVNSQLPPVPAEVFQRDKEAILQDQHKSKIAFLSKARKELQGRYTDFQIVPQLMWENTSSAHVLVEEVFTEPEISNGHEIVPLNRIIPPQQAFQQQVVILEGTAGVGKTSVCRYLVSAWCKDPQSLQCLKDVDILILIRCSSVHSESLPAYLADELLQDTFSDTPRTDILLKMRRTNILLVADGWDEANFTAKALVQHSLSTLPRARVFVTLRPEFALDLRLHLESSGCSFSSFSRNLKLQGFTSTTRREYLRKALRVVSGKTKDSKLLQDIRHLENFSVEMLHIPMTLALLFQLWHSDSAKVRRNVNKQELFRILLSSKMQRLTERHLQQRHRNSNMHLLYQGVQRWINRLSKEAWVALKNNSTVLSRESFGHLKAVCESERLDEVPLFSALVGGFDQRKALWYFEYSVMQQFLAARFLAHELARSGSTLSHLLDFESNSTDYLRYLPTITFTVAILSSKGRMTTDIADEVMALLDDPDVTWETIGDFLLECHLDPLITERSAPLLVNAVCDQVNSRKAGILSAALCYTSLGVPEVLQVHVAAVTSALGDVFTRVAERGCSSVCTLDDESDLVALRKVLEACPDPLPFSLTPTLKVRLASAERAEALAVCLTACQDPNVICYFEATDEEELQYICVFLQQMQDLEQCKAIIVIIPTDPWESLGLSLCLRSLVSSCAWPGSLYLTLHPSFYGTICKEFEVLRLRSDDLRDLRVDYQAQTDEAECEDPYVNSIGRWKSIFAEDEANVRPFISTLLELRLRKPGKKEEPEAEPEAESEAVQEIAVTTTKSKEKNLRKKMKGSFRSVKNFTKDIFRRK
ncbi:uncharacterized protein LOC134786588 [Penaeus indicus]|uniref:uncharacterized protein LOC134786588 n=1 Tax=Penaeus indicus TaxID=29960 RepID=UPI00300C5C2A